MYWITNVLEKKKHWRNIWYGQWMNKEEKYHWHTFSFKKKSICEYHDDFLGIPQ